MISKYSVKRPYTVLVAVVLVIVLGAVSLSKMTTDLLPDMSFQYALVVTTDMGASPEQVESDVTAPIESAMATTSNIKNISSVSYNSYSVVTLEYEQNANMDSVVIEIQQSLDQVSGQWDDSIGTPMIMKVNPDMMPVLAAAVDKDGMDANALSDYVKNDLAPALESLEGVASVTTTGQLEESVDVTLDQDKIDALNKKIQKKIDELEERFNKIKKAKVEIQAIEDAKSNIEDIADEIRNSFGKRLNERASYYISQITNGKYDNLSIDDKLNISVNSKHALIAATRLSKGTIEQIYMALRLAAADIIFEKDKKPILLDDAFAMYDNKRMGNTMRFMAENMEQVIIFSCHTREKLMADKLGLKYNFIRL